MRHALPMLSLALLAACGGGGGGGDDGGDGGGGGGGGGGGDPVASAGGWTRGGNGGVAGGSAGEVSIASYGGDVQVKKASTLPTAPTLAPAIPGLGANPRTITADTTLTPDVDAHVPGDGGGVATGLWVKAGATLTLLPSQGDWAMLAFTDGVVIDGTLRVHFRPGFPADRGFVHLDARGFHVGATGIIELTGGASGKGGTLQVEAVEGFTNLGLIDASGGAGTFGGEGGSMTLEAAAGHAVNHGTIRAHGGAASAGGGGSGGYALLGIPCFTDSGDGVVLVTGTMEARGGAGTLAGGDGGSARAESCGGWTVVTGTLDARGGAGSAGPGGDGGTARAIAVNDALWVLGKAWASGGDGTGAGGAGGEVELRSRTLAARFGGALAAYVGAELDVTGGDGSQGGPGGQLLVEVWQNELAGATAGPLVMAGVDAILANGGDGPQAGGNAGPVYVYSEAVGGAVPDDAGAVSVEPPVESFGGKATGSGGSGGDASEVWLSGKTVSAPKVTANGGPPGTGGQGGAGGEITVASSGGTSTLGGPLSVKGAAGSPAGSHGTVTVDGGSKPLTAGVYTP